MLAYEIVNFLRQQRRGHNGFLALKLDMSKVYNRIEWHFLENIMFKLGFNEIWIQSVLMCVSTVSFSFVINSDIIGYLHPSQGLLVIRILLVMGIVFPKG